MGSTSSGLKGLAAASFNQQGSADPVGELQPSVRPAWKVQSSDQAMHHTSSGATEDLHEPRHASKEGLTHSQELDSCRTSEGLVGLGRILINCGSDSEADYPVVRE